jgi:hypothetical protein
MEKLLKTPLSSTDIMRALPGVSVVKYSELQHMSKLPNVPFVLLYETSPNYGHWVTVLETPEGIEHFDSYGIIPDHELNWIDKDFRVRTGQDDKHLLKLLLQENIGSGKKINYSKFRLQAFDSSVCGRWVILRNLMSSFGNDAFGKAVRSVSKSLKMTPDQLVIATTQQNPAGSAPPHF